MSGKVWILITATFITFIHDVQARCMLQDVKTHLDDLLLEQHMFEMKVFSPETKEHELLSITNTLCSYMIKNEKKDKDKLEVLKTFEIMLHYLAENFIDVCENLNCTDAYTVRRIDTATFGEMYRKSCNGSVSDLKCPSKSTTISPTTEFSTAFLTTVSLTAIDHERTTSLTTLVSPNVTAPENLTAVSSARTETIIQALKDDNQNLWATVQTCSGLLVVSLLLNIVLFLMVFHVHRNSKTNTPRVDAFPLTCRSDMI